MGLDIGLYFRERYDGLLRLDIYQWFYSFNRPLKEVALRDGELDRFMRTELHTSPAALAPILVDLCLQMRKAERFHIANLIPDAFSAADALALVYCNQNTGHAGDCVCDGRGEIWSDFPEAAARAAIAYGKQLLLLRPQPY